MIKLGLKARGFTLNYCNPLVSRIHFGITTMHFLSFRTLSLWSAFSAGLLLTQLATAQSQQQRLPLRPSADSTATPALTRRDTTAPALINTSPVPAAAAAASAGTVRQPEAEPLHGPRLDGPRLDGPRLDGPRLDGPRTPTLPVSDEVPASVVDDTPLAGLLVISNNAHALRVPAIPIREYNVVRSYYVELPFNKTISIIFPSPIKSVDLGSRDIIADKASDVENVLKVKASKVGFNETNYSVITTDGKFYSFVANYNEQPSLLALNLALNTTAADGASRLGGSGGRLPGIHQRHQSEGWRYSVFGDSGYPIGNRLQLRSGSPPAPHHSASGCIRQPDGCHHSRVLRQE